MLTELEKDGVSVRETRPGTANAIHKFRNVGVDFIEVLTPCVIFESLVREGGHWSS